MIPTYRLDHQRRVHPRHGQGPHRTLRRAQILETSASTTRRPRSFPADYVNHIDKSVFGPFVRGATNLGEALRRVRKAHR